MNGKEMTAVVIVFTLAVLMPITIGLMLRMLKGAPRDVQPIADPASNARLDRLEQAMDAIAIEIERISEGQRFVTKVLTERNAPPASLAERQSRHQSNTPH
jgi:hypothetical protein